MPPDDRGTTFIELLISIVLLGTAIIATLVALQATTIASRVDADHARAFAWLQAASDEVFTSPRVPCNEYDGSGDPDQLSSYVDRRGSPGDAPSDAANATVWARYKFAAAAAPRPEGWSAASVEVTGIEFLGRPDPDATFFEWDANYCFEGLRPDANGDGRPEDYRTSPLLSQKVSIRVTSPNGNVVKTIETVKSD